MCLCITESFTIAPGDLCVMLCAFVFTAQILLVDHFVTVVDGVERPVHVGDVVQMQAGCRHTVLADSELQLIEVQLGKEISVHDKQKFPLEQETTR